MQYEQKKNNYFDLGYHSNVSHSLMFYWPCLSACEHEIASMFIPLTSLDEVSVLPLRDGCDFLPGAAE